MSSQVAVRLGSQQPRVVVLPEGRVASAGADAGKLMAACGKPLYDWQQTILDAGLAERSDGLWAASSVDVIASRQNGKNGAVEARELYGAVILGEWIIHTAHLFKTAKESFDRLLELVEAEPDVEAQLTYKVASPASGYEMRFASGGRVIFIARSRTSGRGLTGDVLVFDEAQDLNDDALGALLPTISQGPRGNPQSWYLGSAPGPLSLVWHRRRKAGRRAAEAGDGRRMAYFEHSADPDCDLDDRAAWAQANPGLGSRLLEESVEAERAAMSDEMFARERLSVSPDIDVDELWEIIPEASWRDCQLAAHEPSKRPAFALDVDVNANGEEWCSVGMSDGRHVEVVTPPDAGPGTDWVVDAVAAKKDRFDEILVDPAGPAGKLIAPLEARGVKVRQVKPAEFVQASQQVKDAAGAGELVHLGQQVLDRAVAGAVARDVGDGAWKLSRSLSSVDISPFVAVMLARFAALESKPKAPLLAMVLGGS